MSHKTKELVDRYRVDHPKKFRIKKTDPQDTWKFKASELAKKELLENGLESLAKMQETLYAQARWGILLIFQAMDGGGKDGTIKHVMRGINPQGCQVHSFKSPSTDELAHDYLWRCSQSLPARGQIGIFNRSYYEETLVVRVHPEYLEKEQIPEELVTRHIWKERFEDINAFERYLTRNGVVVRKFFLNISKEEQKRRFISRLEEKDKNWKFSEADLRERLRWDDYMDAYEEMIRNTSTNHAPWFVVPSDNKWFSRLVVAEIIADTMASLNLAFPKVDAAQRKVLAAGRKALVGKAAH